eukprot:TRINITY_DN7203_c0_g1_i1.p1 TRINITY_DN7203_c0_g1~~TRINITY_DN7203_c0_g1_i1.p1  ORF type:complete len:289 (+),score=115.49 TRINITY_DN7203_c0_g1_i1:48-869(+)
MAHLDPAAPRAPAQQVTAAGMAAAVQAQLAGQRVLMAAAVGSRMKQLDAPGSDVDMRVVSLDVKDARAAAWSEVRDGVEYEYLAWGAERFLDLLKGSNAEAVDSLMSPLQLAAAGAEAGFVAGCRALLRRTLCLRQYAAALLSNCTKNWKTYSRNAEVVNHRHYLYVLAPILGLRCLLEDGQLPPPSFNERLCRTVCDPDLHETIMALVYEKRDGQSRWLRIPRIDAFIVHELEALKAQVAAIPPRPLADEEAREYDALATRRFDGPAPPASQ